MKFEFTEQALNNLLIFIDRIQFSGLKELQAINEIMTILNNPIKEENIEDNNK